MRRARTAVAAALAVVAAALAGTAVAMAAGIAPQPSPNLRAYTAKGRVLPPDPVLHRGDRVRIVVTGYGAGSPVVARLGGAAAETPVAADAHGVLTYAFTVARSLPDGDYVLTFVGAGANSAPATPAAAPATTGPGDPQVLQVVAPNGGFFPFRVRVSGGPGGPSTSASASVSASETARSEPGTNSASGRHLSSTGVDVLAPLVLGALAVLVGAVSVRLGLGPRRGRRQPDH